MPISPATKLTAIIGNPVTHSLSPLLHNKIYADEGIDAVMLAFGNPSIEKLVAAIRALPIHMSAVTMPHKQTIMPLLDTIDDVAQDIGAVNTVINVEGKLHGYNTDVVGVAKALEGVPLSGKNALIVGAGGAARTVVYHLKREGANVFVTNRDWKQAQELCSEARCSIIEESNLSANAYDVIINATPIGMNPKPEAMPIPEELLHAKATVFDLVYSPLETQLLKSARAKGSKAISGLVMFLAQGLEQERLWLGKDIDSSRYSAMLEEYVRKRG